MGIGASLDKKIYSFFKKGVYDGAISILGALQFDGNLRVAYTSVTGTALYINKAANTGPTIKAHCHQLAASSTVYGDQVVANEFKGEFKDTIGSMDGIASHFRLNANSAGVMRAILGVAYLDSGKTLSGALSTGGWIVGGLFSVAISGVVNGAAVHVLGAYAGLGSMSGATLTACLHMAALMVDSQVVQVPSSGQSELIYLHNGAGATLNQVLYIDANDRISEFAHFVNCATMISAKTDADVAYAHYRKLLVTVDGAPGWIYVEMAA